MKHRVPQKLNVMLLRGNLLFLPGTGRTNCRDAVASAAGVWQGEDKRGFEKSYSQIAPKS